MEVSKQDLEEANAAIRALKAHNDRLTAILMQATDTMNRVADQMGELEKVIKARCERKAEG